MRIQNVKHKTKCGILKWRLFLVSFFFFILLQLVRYIIIISFIHLISSLYIYKRNTTGGTNGAGSACPSRALELHQSFNSVRATFCFVFHILNSHCLFTIIVDRSWLVRILCLVSRMFCITVSVKVSIVLWYLSSLIKTIGVSDCCLTPTQQFFSYIMARTS
jgi:hypothetical protein